jgi:hypothetical protein
MKDITKEYISLTEYTKEEINIETITLEIEHIKRLVANFIKGSDINNYYIYSERLEYSINFKEELIKEIAAGFLI